MPRRLRLLAPALAVALLAGSCGGGDDDAASTTTSRPEVDDTEPERQDAAADTSVPEETLPDAEAEDPPGESGGEDEGLGDPAVFVSDLDGGAEVPGPGHPTARGRLEAESDGDGRLCFDMVAEGLGGEVTGAHIHEGTAGGRGDVVIAIGPPDARDGDPHSWTDVCVDVGDDVLERVAADPSGFYANVHTGEFGDGAIRGQLELATIFDLTLS